MSVGQHWKLEYDVGVASLVKNGGILSLAPSQHAAKLDHRGLPSSAPGADDGHRIRLACQRIHDRVGDLVAHRQAGAVAPHAQAAAGKRILKPCRHVPAVLVRIRYEDVPSGSGRPAVLPAPPPMPDAERRVDLSLAPGGRPGAWGLHTLAPGWPGAQPLQDAHRYRGPRQPEADRKKASGSSRHVRKE